MAASLIHHVASKMLPRAYCMSEWAVQETQYFHLAADYVRSNLAISRSEPLVEDESIEALASLSRFSLTEVVTMLCSPPMFSQVHRRLADRTAELARGCMGDFAAYRGFVPYIMPLCIELLGHRRNATRVGPDGVGSVHAELMRSLPLVREWEAAGDRGAQLRLRLGDVRAGPVREFLDACHDRRRLCRRKRSGTRLVYEFNPTQLNELLSVDNSNAQADSEEDKPKSRAQE
jgi:hypothetical protein